jgi:hypothetical protein
LVVISDQLLAALAPNGYRMRRMDAAGHREVGGRSQSNPCAKGFERRR